MTTAYCATCRTYFIAKANPPYAVIHTNAGRMLRHLHPITRQELKPAPLP